MIPRNVIKIASAFVLLAASACGDDDPEETNERDAAVDSGRADGGDAATDGGPKADARIDSGANDAGDIDATTDSAVPTDAQIADATTDAQVIVDAGLDAAQTDAGTDAGTDANLPALTAWYKFDETSGTTADDATDNFANGMVLNGATWVAGKNGNAIDLAGGVSTGANHYVALPRDILAECEDVTVALWMKLGTVTNWSRLLDIDGKVNGFIYFTPAQDVGPGVRHLLFNIFKDDFGQNDPRNDRRVSAAYPTGTVLEGVWHHVAFTLSDGMGRLYFDGVQIGMNEMSNTPADVPIGDNGVAWMGRAALFPDPYLDATLDDLRISCTAYSAEQIAAIAQ
jgi:hypothetical protein